MYVNSGDDKFGWHTNANYSFLIQAEKQISLPKGKITSLKSSSSGKLTLSCEAVSDAIGYRVLIATDEKFTDKKVKYVPSNSVTMSGLKKGKRYYVKVCPYTVYDDGVRVFGQNSLVKSIVIKK